MKLYFRYLHIFILFFYIHTGLFCQNKAHKNHIQDSTSYYTNQIKKAVTKSKLFPDKSYHMFDVSKAYFEKKRDTVHIVHCLLGMSEIQKKKGKFSRSFDHLWQAKYLSDFSKNKAQKVRIRIDLARLYDEFNMNEQSVLHLGESLKIAKEIYVLDSTQVKHLISSYMYMAVRQRKSGNHHKAMQYLDSCFINPSVKLEKSVEMPFWDAERGKIMQELKQYGKASTYLHLSRKHTLDKQANYRPNISMYLGDLKKDLGQKDSALYFYNESLSLSRDHGFRNDLEAEVLRKIAEVYSMSGEKDLAYDYLIESTRTADQILQAKNQTNSELFQIKDTYLKSISKKDALLEQKNIIIEKNFQIQRRLQIIMGLLVLLGIVIFIVVRTRLKLKKTVLRQKEAELHTKLISERSKNEIEIKSKQLTSYALQLIDKDSAIDELLDMLKKEGSPRYKSLFSKYKKGSNDLWNEFNLQFTQVNSAFYDKLKEHHPSLSSTEQKHCALIKLNLTTKDMARILNIEPHSVHVSRSRIRKKMGLERSQNLENYISSI
ncbi:helix-turn-helix domain-containing protein [Zobellia galactanivorans]|uniref:Conserved hypothetical membrane protein n=1 Tax=Zobellia galactanivorans (strain DSM 12802 / CCUG 47099 / CIP 106680 / NCIMB 13871 / Dsij) TaxID=63186 RepID=G0L8Z2_ZOBGA|nr:hypothetical protein [Zobellia galactanivorans]CAZ94280.1 Conserved hypothetical membrane protein [Zobellia galactanivorans]